MKKNIILGLFIVAAVVIGILVIQWFNQAMKLAEEDRAREQEYAQQMVIQKCLEGAYDTYVADWNGQCEIEHLQDDCLLSNYRAQQLDEQYEKAQALCVERFK